MTEWLHSTVIVWEVASQYLFIPQKRTCRSTPLSIPIPATRFAMTARQFDRSEEFGTGSCLIFQHGLLVASSWPPHSVRSLKVFTFTVRSQILFVSNIENVAGSCTHKWCLIGVPYCYHANIYVAVTGGLYAGVRFQSTLKRSQW